jgi:hypothetical protein
MRPIPTVSECAAHGWVLMATCRTCRVGRDVDTSGLPDVKLDALRPMLKCSRCGKRDSALSVAERVVGKYRTILVLGWRSPDEVDWREP